MKKSILLMIFSLVLVLTLQNLASAALGIMPAKREYNFVPNGQISIEYTIISDVSDKKIEAYTKGDLAEYVTLSYKNFVGGGTFTATINMPASVEKVGRNKLYIGLKEVAEESGATISAIAQIEALVIINVPYPGRYIEAGLSVPDCNVGDEIPVELKVINRGKETLEVSPSIDIFDSGKNIVQSMSFSSLTMVTGEEKIFKKMLSTKEFKPGEYFAEATIDFGNIQKVNKTFRVGSMFVDITNFTRELEIGGLRKFFVEVESQWNDNIDEVYADVNVSDGDYSIAFRTPPADLIAWQKKKLEGYVDTSEMKGDYNTNIIVSYQGQKSYAEGKLNVYEKKADKTLMIIAGAIIAAVIAALIALRMLRKAKPKLRKR